MYLFLGNVSGAGKSGGAHCSPGQRTSAGYGGRCFHWVEPFERTVDKLLRSGCVMQSKQHQIIMTEKHKNEF